MDGDSGRDRLSDIEEIHFDDGVIYLDGRNNDPLAQDDHAYTAEDAGITIAALGNDRDIDRKSGLKVVSVDAGGTLGQVRLNPDGTIAYHPNGQFDHLADGDTATDTFTYTIKDKHGGRDTATVTVTIIGKGGNTAPVAQADVFTTAEDVALTGNVLADNGGGADADPDGDALTIATTPVAGPVHGVLVLAANGSFTYTPDADFHGADSFTYGVSDGDGGSDQATVSITVDPVADVPNLSVADASGEEGGAIALDVTAALADLDGSETLTLWIEDIPVGATLSDGANSFTASAGDTSADIRTWNLAGLTITVSDAGDYDLTVRATATETANGDSDETIATLNLEVEVAPTVVFRGSDFLHGRELWQYDGSSVAFLADIDVGSGSSNPGEFGGFVELSGDLYFTAHDGTSGYELRKLDGSTGAVSLVADLRAGLGGSNPGEFGGFAELNGDLYFTAHDGTNGYELHKLDGSTGLASLVADLRPGSGGSNPGEFGGFVELEGDLYFTAHDGANGYELHKLDGSTGLASLVADIYAGTGSSAAGLYEFAEFGGDLYFTAADPINGHELRRLDGTTGEVSLVTDIHAGSASSNAGAHGGFAELNGDLYFTAHDPTNGYELRKLDGTTGTVSLVADISAGFGNSEAGASGGFVEFEGDLYFTAHDPTNGYELRKLDGSTGAISLVADIHAGSSPSRPTEFHVFGDELVFTANDGTGRHLFSYDGTALTKRTMDDLDSAALDPGQLHVYGDADTMV